MSSSTTTNLGQLKVHKVPSLELWKEQYGQPNGIGENDVVAFNPELFDSYVTAGQRDGTTLGEKATAEGYQNEASGQYSHAEGSYSRAIGNQSHAEGNSIALNTLSHSEGSAISRRGWSHAEGYNSQTCGQFSHSEGSYTLAYGDGSHAEGKGYPLVSFVITGAADTTTYQVLSDVSDYIGKVIVLNNDSSGAIITDYYTESNNKYITVDQTLSSEALNQARVTAYHGVSYGDYSHSEGQYTMAIGESSHAEGQYTIAVGIASHSEGGGEDGSENTANGDYSHVEGYQNSTGSNGAYAHVEGTDSFANGSAAHAEGMNTYATNTGAHSEGNGTEATGVASHSEGISTHAIGDYSHAEGSYTSVSSASSHAEGSSTRASGTCSHAEGAGTSAEGSRSHAEGQNTRAAGIYSHAEGLYTTANHQSQHVFGEYNELDSSAAASDQRGTYVEIVGNGTSGSNRSNARTLDWNGNEWIAGTLTVGNNPQLPMQVATKEYVDDHDTLGYITVDSNTGVGTLANPEWNHMYVPDSADGGIVSNLTITLSQPTNLNIKNQIEILFRNKGNSNITPSVVGAGMTVISLSYGPSNRSYVTPGIIGKMIITYLTSTYILVENIFN